MSEFNWMRETDRKLYVNALLEGFRHGMITADAACRDLRDIILSSTRIRLALGDERHLTRRIATIFRSLQMGALPLSRAHDLLENLLTAAVGDDARVLTADPATADA